MKQVYENTLLLDGCGQYTDALASTMDFTPTILDWFGVNASTIKAKLSGKSLLPLTEEPDNITNYQTVFSSHNFHEVSRVLGCEGEACVLVLVLEVVLKVSLM